MTPNGRPNAPGGSKLHLLLDTTVVVKPLRVIGIQTDDFAAYHDMVQLLRTQDVPFLSLSPGEEIPPRVGVVVTSASEASAIIFSSVVVYTTPEETLESASRVLAGFTHFGRCVVGIDPGERPGVALLADGRVLRLVHATSPETVRDAVEHAMQTVPADTFIIRIGNGAPTFRDRILHALEDLPVAFELVDETRSTPSAPRGAAHRDTAAATSIALTAGTPMGPADMRPVRPSEGELRDIQRKSRLASEGQVTISRALARYVALGHFTLGEAVDRQRSKNHGDENPHAAASP